MKIYILLSLIFVFASQTLASSKDEFGEYITRMGQKMYTRRFSTPSPTLQKPSTTQETSTEAIKTLTSTIQTLSIENRSVYTETDIIPFKSVGVSTDPEVKIPMQATAIQTEKLLINDMSSQTKQLVLEDKETNTAPFEGHGKHLYNVTDKTTQTQSRELVEGEAVKPLLSESVELN
jgi:hypothetical protein